MTGTRDVAGGDAPASRPRVVAWTTGYLVVAGAWCVVVAAYATVVTFRPPADVWDLRGPAAVVAVASGAVAALHVAATLGRRCKRTWGLRLAALTAGLCLPPMPVGLIGLVLAALYLREPTREWYLASDHARSGPPQRAP